MTSSAHTRFSHSSDSMADTSSDSVNSDASSVLLPPSRYSSLDPSLDRVALIRSIQGEDSLTTIFENYLAELDDRLWSKATAMTMKFAKTTLGPELVNYETGAFVQGVIDSCISRHVKEHQRLVSPKLSRAQIREWLTPAPLVSESELSGTASEADSSDSGSESAKEIAEAVEVAEVAPLRRRYYGIKKRGGGGDGWPWEAWYNGPNAKRTYIGSYKTEEAALHGRDKYVLDNNLDAPCNLTEEHYKRIDQILNQEQQARAEQAVKKRNEKEKEAKEKEHQEVTARIAAGRTYKGVFPEAGSGVECWRAYHSHTVNGKRKKKWLYNLPNELAAVYARDHWILSNHSESFESSRQLTNLQFESEAASAKVREAEDAVRGPPRKLKKPHPKK